MTPFITNARTKLILFHSEVIRIYKLSHPNKCLLISFKRSKTINFPPKQKRTNSFVEISFKSWNGYGKAKCLLPVCFSYYVKYITKVCLYAIVHIIMASNWDKNNDKKKAWKHPPLPRLLVLYEMGTKLSGLTL